VRGERQLRVDLAIPSPGRIREALCGVRAASVGAVVFGIVRDARDDTASWRMRLLRGALFVGVG